MPSLSEIRDAPRRWWLRGLVGATVLVLLVSSVSLTVAYEAPELQAGTVEEPADGDTLVAVQGFHFQGQGNRKKPARLVRAGPDGEPNWVYNGSRRGASWFYDADPLPNGNYLAVNTIRENGHGKTMVYELDPETKERVWEVKLNITDTHDVDLINGDQLLVANMREWDAKNETSNDQLFIYDMGEDEVVWRWYFRNHYPNDTDGGMKPDWSHVNDVDKVGEGKYMASPRNFDQVIVVDRETKNITTRLGEDDDYSVIYEQHNPTYLETEDGDPTILVADSENNRVVEYTCTERVDGECQWELVWEVGDEQLNWPRDADRLPNGNTLITDSRGHRVIEVTPQGEIVWETYAPWAPFSAERIEVGNDGVTSPTMQDLNVSGSYELSGSAGLTPGTEGGKTTFPQWLDRNLGWVPLLSGPVSALADAWQAGAQWIRPVWMAPWTLVHLSAATLVALLWGVAELVYGRRRVAARAGRLADRLRGSG